ncbi:MAG: hypothetical protein AB7O66_16460 [Limisphaerales bacterium]
MPPTRTSILAETGTPSSKGRRWPALLVAVLTSVAAWGQGKSGIKIEVPTVVDWTAPIAGEDGRTVMLVKGAKATPSLGSGQMEITQFRLETYRYAPDRITELVVESPLGRFGSQGAGSGERLTLRSADNRFSIEGTGWSWARGTGLLVISNAVETSVRRGKGETNRPPIQVRSRRFEYNLRTGDARYVGDCVAEDSGRARVSAGELRSRLSPSQTEPDAIQGTNGVVIELLRPDKPGRAVGQGATYVAATADHGERIELVGRPTWQFGPSQGTADLLVLMPAGDAYTAKGRVNLSLVEKKGSRTPHMSHVSPKSHGPGETHETNEPNGTNGTAITITCEVLEARGTNLVFTGPVRARQEGRFELSGGGLTASLGPDRETGETTVLAARATGDVVARLGDGAKGIELKGQAMTYTAGVPSLIEVDGEPGWRGLEHQGTARLFRMHPETQAFEAIDQVKVRWVSRAEGSEPVPVDIAASRLRVDGDLAAFRGGVTATGVRWEMAAAEADLGLGTNRTVRGIDARGDVRFRYEMRPPRPGTKSPGQTLFRTLGDGALAETRRWEITSEELRVVVDPGGDGVSELEASGGVNVRHPSVRARGGRLAYAALDGRLRLMDDAELRAVDGLDIQGMPGTVLTMDPKAMRFGVEGPVKRWRMPALMFRERASTNAPAPPSAPSNP